MPSEPGRGRDLAFFGAVTASATHEIRNVFAIIAEHAGLVEDLLEPSAHAPPDPKKLKALASKIGAQVKRGDEIMSRLNRFAHSMDQPKSKSDMNALLHDMLRFAERLAARRNITLEAEMPAQAILVDQSRFHVQQAVFYALKLVVDTAPARTSLRVKLDEHGPVARVSITAPSSTSDEAGEEKRTALNEAVEALGGACEFSVTGTGSQTLVICFPR